MKKVRGRRRGPGFHHCRGGVLEAGNVALESVFFQVVSGRVAGNPNPVHQNTLGVPGERQYAATAQSRGYRERNGKEHMAAA